MDAKTQGIITNKTIMTAQVVVDIQGLFLITWFNFDPSMDNGWIYLSIPKLQLKFWNG